MFIAKLVQRLCQRRYERFKRALHYPYETQCALQHELFRSFCHSSYGKSLNVKQWDHIPIVSYRDLLPWIESNGLTREAVKHYVYTSGSSAKPKKIPYTHALKQSFISLFKVWVYDLLSTTLKPETGKIFISISPPTALGMTDDTEYLSPLLKLLLTPYLVWPPSDCESFQDRLAIALLQEKHLEVISIWNPSYLILLLRHIEQNREHLMRSIKDERCWLLEQDPIEWKALWPKLQLISCWTSGWAKDQACALRRYFPDVPLQGKGLLATEAPLTVPLQGASDPVPLLDEVFLEFENKLGNIFSIQEIQSGEVYEIILSQKGGLIRYRIGDRVRVTGRFQQTPCLEFVGRSGSVCDMVGEKMDASTVESLLQEVFSETPATKLLVPIYQPAERCYYLLLTDTLIPYLAERLEKALQQVYHYRVARITGQLGHLQVKHVPDLLNHLHAFYRQEGMKWGEIKDLTFIPDPNQAVKLLREKHSPII